MKRLQLPSILGYFIGGLLVLTAVKPTLVDALRVYGRQMPAAYIDYDPSYPTRGIGGLGLILLSGIFQNTTKKKQ